MARRRAGPTRGAASWAVAFALVVVFAILLVRTAWVCDDAFITLRVVDNAVNGFGLRWNVAERVQVYTHPLWMLALLPLYAITREPFFTTLGLGLACSLAAVGWIGWRWREDPSTAAAILVPLVASRAFVDYSTSGLENPLVHLLLVAFVMQLPGAEGGVDRRRMLGLGALAGLAVLCRPDAGLLLAPALGLAAWRRGPRAAAGELALGLAPLLAWVAFATAYYGLPHPNTALAKLATGIPERELLAQGARYLAESLRNDPATLAATAAAATAALALGGARERLLAAGAALYLAYTVKVGGDFMSGRFLAAPLLLALLAGAPAAAGLRGGRAALALWALALSFAAPITSWLPGAELAARRTGAMDASGITDERRFYFPVLGWRNGARDPERPLANARRPGLALRRANATLAVEDAIGLRGYYAGPGVHLVDLDSLADPLLARLPMVERDPSFASIREMFGHPEPAPPWRIGHFARAVPAGYLATLLTGENRLADAGIRALWDRVATVTRGPVWSAARWRIVAGWWIDGGRLERPRPPWTPIPWREALELRPQDPGLLLGRAVGRLKTGRTAKALEDLDAALAVDPSNLEALALAVLAREGLGDRVGAERLARRAVGIDPRDPELQSLLGATLAGGGDLRGAIEAYRQALHGDRLLAAAAKIAIGRCLVGLGEAEAALDWLRQGVAADPANEAWRSALHEAQALASAR